MRRLAPLALLVVLASCGSSDSKQPASGGKVKQIKLQLTDKGCSPASASVPAGAVRIEVKNPGTSKTDEVELKNKDGIILGERENLAPGLGSDFTLTLQPGTYVLNCTFQNDQRDNGKVTVTGAPTKTATADDALLNQAVADYKRDVKQETGKLVGKTSAFVAALHAGDVAKAKALFGPARIHYESIEPIAESFGNLDPEIDARVNDVAKPSQWTGFHRIEQILWQKDTTAGTAGYAKKLLADVKKLDASVDGLNLQPEQIANGAVGLLDEVSSSKITGEEDRYSHTDMSDFQGNFTGARQAFDVLKPALVEEGDKKLVGQIQTRIAAVQRGLDRYKRSNTLGFATYSALTKKDKRQFAQQIAALAEPLSQVAGKVIRS